MRSFATVLVVEDEPLILMDIAYTLSSAGYQVVEALSADQAIGLLASGLEIDILVTDVDMPGSTDRIALAELVATTVPGTRILVTSGRYDVEAMVPAGSTFVSKPVAPEVLPRNLGMPMRNAA